MLGGSEQWSVKDFALHRDQTMTVRKMLTEGLGGSMLCVPNAHRHYADLALARLYDARAIRTYKPSLALLLQRLLHLDLKRTRATYEHANTRHSIALAVAVCWFLWV